MNTTAAIAATEVDTATAATTSTTATTTATAAKAPSKKSQAVAIFTAALARRAAGQYTSNKDFRAAVLTELQTTLSVSLASAATMYNSAKSEAEAADPTLTLGRDPKVVKVKNPAGRRGRPGKNSVTAATEADAGEDTAATANVVVVDTADTTAAAEAEEALI